MNLRSVDLNLLVIFDTLMTERHVTRAALKVPMSQPAMSSALARLRLLFKDDLFVRVGGNMEPTARALELSVGVSRILRETERLMNSDVMFDASTSEHHSVGRMSDLVSYLVLPKLLRRLELDAPAMKLDVKHISIDETLKGLEDERLDFAVSTQLEHTNSIVSQPVFTDRLVCVMRPGHPLAGKKMSMDEFLAAGHIHVAVTSHDLRFVDNTLVESKLERNIVITVPHWLILPAVLSDTNYIAVFSEKLARQLPDGVIAWSEMPFFCPTFNWELYWHKRNQNSAPHVWMRSLITESCNSLD
ncbi:LysR family transcriptional regulator [Pseudomonas lurida]|uniref:LysR family transcriptional regulator n=1 Tax=Pseudomonas TaxID=286 RepID=UPI0015E36AB1|nr:MULTISPECIES: LysR family transcriptional regulator [Pseudomonas]MBA1292463.1 LysR family transcriptional regulator [Pseudomonas lurida]